VIKAQSLPVHIIDYRCFPENFVAGIIDPLRSAMPSDDFIQLIGEGFAVAVI
jgi:hypothetical protein